MPKPKKMLKLMLQVRGKEMSMVTGMWFDPGVTAWVKRIEQSAARIELFSRMWFDTGDEEFHTAYQETLDKYEKTCHELVPHIREKLVNLRERVFEEIRKLENALDIDKPESRPGIIRLLRLHNQHDILNRVLL